MTKVEKYWVFSMVLLGAIKPQEVPSLWRSLSNVSLYVAGLACFVLMVWFFIRGEK